MKQPYPRRVAAGALALGTATLLAIAAPLSASAHVSLEQNTAAPGTFTTLTFRVPNETADGASTTRLTVTLPADKALFGSVSYEPVPGWSAQLVTSKLPKPVTAGNDTVTEAVTQVIWTAAPGSEYGPGSLGIFKLYLGPVPDVGQVKLPVDQGYSDGTVVSWDGAVTSQHPAPVLYVNDKPVADEDPDSAPVATVTPSASRPAEPDAVARILAGAGLLLGAVALVIAIVGRSSSGRRPKKAS